MANVNPSITSIISDGIDSFTYTTANRQTVWGDTNLTAVACYKWLKVAYPDIFKEFEAVQDVMRGVDGS